MIRINLAPPVEHQHRRLSPTSLAAVSIAALGGLGAWYAVLARGEAQLSEHVAALTSELTTLKTTLAHGESARDALRDLGRRTQAIQELTRAEGLAARALDAVIDVVPPELWLTALEGRGLELRVTGAASTARAVAAFTANLRASANFKDVEIAMSRQDLGKTPPAPVSFEVTCRLSP
jgi:Tfp pilus assembly protein PilN